VENDRFEDDRRIKMSVSTAAKTRLAGRRKELMTSRSGDHFPGSAGAGVLSASDNGRSAGHYQPALHQPALWG
jgi:hypothetical protein